MDEKRKLWEEIRDLSLRDICCSSPVLYGMFTEIFQKEEEGQASGTDGEVFYVHLDSLFNLYQKQGLKGMNRQLLHTLFHVLYLHVTDRKPKEETALWQLACDMVCEYTIDSLQLETLTGSMECEAKLFCREIWAGQKSLDTQQVYERLLKRKQEGLLSDKWEVYFSRDCHSIWKAVKEDCLEAILKKMGSFGTAFTDGKAGIQGKAGTEAGHQQEWYEVQEERKQSYHRFLKRFTVEKEEMQLDTESFDYISYLYGLIRYGNLPILEPLEYTEAKKLEELVIAIDTSSSCSREVVQRFLEETYSVLSRQEYFFKKIKVHIIQCDCYIQEDVTVTCEKEWKAYLRHIKIQGRGGTDFRPVFRYVDELQQKGELCNLKGLLYFTDGDGIYPTEKPDYETAFLLTKAPPKEANVPLWAEILYMDEREQEGIFL